MKNKNLKLLAAELANLDFKVGKSIVAFPADEIEGLTLPELMKKFDAGKFSATILDGFRKKVFDERDSLINEALDFYSTKLQFNATNPAMTPEEVLLMIEAKIIRIKRLMMVFQPDFYPSVTKKANGEEYDMVKLNWISDDNIKFIKISKTYGLKGKAGLESSVRKMIRDYFISEAESLEDWRQLQKYAIELRADQLVSIGGKKWVVEVKHIDKEEFIKAAMRLELWDYYYQTYLAKPVNLTKIEI
jgi:hypothetical protein